MLLPTDSTSQAFVERKKKKENMHQKGSHRQNLVVSVSSSDGGVVCCPKPRRIGPHLPPCSPSLHINDQEMETYDAKGGNELLDIILLKGRYGADKHNFHAATSPPFFSGSPPSRASNPVIQDEQFGNCKLSLFPPVSEPSASPSLRVKYGHGSAAPVRIEGFNCRNRCSISAVA